MQELLSYLVNIAGIINFSVYIPQIIKIIRLKKSTGISLSTFTIAGIIQGIIGLDAIYRGVLIFGGGMILSGILCFFIVYLSILYMKNK